MKCTRGTMALLLLSLMACSSTPPARIASTARAAETEQKPDIGDWTIQDPKISPIDGVKTQFLYSGSDPRLALCFENGKLCSRGSLPVFVTSPCFVEGGDEEGTRYERRVRLRFDTDKFLVETWGISDDHSGIYPHSPKTFISALKMHKSLALEFGCARSDSYVATFDIHGLQAALDSAGLK